MKIRMVFDDRVVPAGLDDTRMGHAVGNMLPIEEYGSTWGEEVYFSLELGGRGGAGRTNTAPPARWKSSAES